MDPLPLICAQQDHVLSTKAQSSSSLLYGVVALWERKNTVYNSPVTQILAKLLRKVSESVALV